MTKSYMVVNKETEIAVLEFYNPNFIEKINTKKYKAVTTLYYLQNLNKQLKSQYK